VINLKGAGVALLVAGFSFATLEAKSTISKEVEKLGRELQKETALMFSKENFLNQDDLLAEDEEGQTFDHKSPPRNLLEADVTEVVERGQTFEAIDEAEPFLQQSLKICSNADEYDYSGGLQVINNPQGEVEIRTETCEDHVSRLYTALQIREVNVIPEVLEKRKTCKGHKKEKEFFWKGEANKQVEDWKKALSKDASLKTWDAYVDSGGVFKDYHVIKIWTHKDDVAHCDNFQIETKIVQNRQEKITWRSNDQELLAWLENNPICYLHSRTQKEDNTRNLVYRCERGENRQCQILRESGGILQDKKCIAHDPEGNCITYLKTFAFHEREPLRQEYFLDDIELFNLEDFETNSEPDNSFGWVISRLAAEISSRGAAEPKTNDPMKAEIFPGKVMKCKRGCSSTVLYDCCSDPRGWLLDLKGVGAKCTEDERKLWEHRQAGKCHYIGTKDLKFGLEKEQVYICYPDVLSRVIQEEAHEQLNISWGDAEEPNEKSLVLEQIPQLNFEIMDLSDIEKDLMEKIDQDAIAEKIKSTAGSFNAEDVKRQTENLLREDKKRCFE
jgi:hypothetical protein